MEREEFIKEVKQLAIDFWTMNMKDGSYETNFIKLLDEYENKLLSCNYCGSTDIRKD